MGAAKPDFRKPWKQRLACWWGYADPDARPETGPSSVDELLGRMSLLPSDDDEPPEVSPPRLRPPRRPELLPSDDDEPPGVSPPRLRPQPQPQAASEEAAEPEPEPDKKKPKRAPRSREMQLHALSQKALLDAHEEVRQRLLEKRKLPGHEGLQVPEAPVSPELPAARLVELVLKLEKRERYNAPAHLNGFVAPAKLEAASLTLSGRWGDRLEWSPAPEGGWLVCDFFCSIGGFSSGARALGHKIVLAIDVDGDQLAVHALNHEGARHVQMELGPKVTDVVLQLIEDVVPASERHRLWCHLSPPCQSQSKMRQLGMACSAQGRQTFQAINDESRPLSEYERQEERRKHDETMKADKTIGLSLVQWAIDLIVKLKPAQHSIEEVNDKQGEVMELMGKAKRAHPELFDCAVFQMEAFGIPHRRERAICARPATIAALRDRPALRTRAPTVREVIGDSLEPEIHWICGPVQRSLAKPGTAGYNVRPKPRSNLGLDPVTKYTDGLMSISSLDGVSGTICTRELALLDDKKQVVRYTTPDEMRKLTTFPTYVWPKSANQHQQRLGYGNAVPCRFASAIFRAASSE